MPATRDLVIGIDSSTTACKAVVWDTLGAPLSEGRAALPLLMSHPGWHEQPAAVWWDSCMEAIRAAVSRVDASRIVALCLAPQRETFVPVDAAGSPLRSAIVWMDERARDLLPTIDREYGAERIHRETGKPLSVNLTLGKIAWLRQHEPDVFARTARYLDVAAFLIHKLTGHYYTGWGCADPTGLFDMRTNCWDADLLAYLGVRVEQMPEAYPPGAAVGTVTPEAAILTGLPAGLPIVAGVGDGQVSGLGVNITRPGQAYLSLGTSVISGTYADAYVIDCAFRTLYGAVSGSYNVETALLGGGYTIAWFVDKIAKSADERIEDAYDAAIADIPPGAAGLLLVPYWNSVLNPYWDAAASGIVIGWRGVHTRAHLYRAILEGIAFEQRLCTEGVEVALGQPVESYVAMGGGARSDRWLHIIADVTGKPVYRAAVTEATALGAGILAATGAGLFPDARAAADAMTHIEPEPFTPDEARHEIYSRLYNEVYRHLYPALQPYLSRLTAFAEDTVRDKGAQDE
jgi:sugar (pentulose or hexulose) kinase